MIDTASLSSLDSSPTGLSVRCGYEIFDMLSNPPRQGPHLRTG
jgi:hypothetical protein